MRILAFAASLRRASLNRRLVELAAAILRARGDEVDLADFGDFAMPIYDGDLDAAGEKPPGAVALRRRLEAAQGLVLASPEYNYSIGGPLKNAIDWVSRFRPMPWRGRSVYLLSASPSPMGGIRGLWQARIPLEGCGAFVFPDMFALAHADRAFAPDGTLADPKLGERLEKELVGFACLAERLAAATGEAPPLDRQRIVAALEEESELQPAPS